MYKPFEVFLTDYFSDPGRAIIMATLGNRAVGQAIIFLPCDFYLSIFLFFFLA